MFTYKSIDYTDFSEFAQAKSHVFDNVDFSEAISINKSINDITSNDVNNDNDKIENCCVYAISGIKFAVSIPFDGIETTSTGIKNKRKRRLVRLENENNIKRFDDITQLKRILGAATGQRPSGIVCKGRKKIDEEVISAKFAEFAEFCKSLHIPFNHIGLLDMALYEYRRGIKEAELAEKMARYKKAGLSDTEIELLTKLA